MAAPDNLPATDKRTSGGAGEITPVMVREKLLEQIRSDNALPTLGVAISKVVEITSTGEDSVSALAHFILADVALTKQILRLSNTITYRTAGNISVTTISRAIFLLGFDTIKANALATLLVDGFRNTKQAHAVRKELVQALCASVAAREIARGSSHANSEEAAVAALFKNIGRILVASFDHDTYEKISSSAQTENRSANETCTRFLGCSYERLGETVLRDWSIPDTIVNALQALPLGDQKKASTRNDWLKQVASFSESLAEILVDNNPNGETQPMVKRCAPLLKRFGTALEIDTAQLTEILKRVEAETSQLAISLEVTLAPISLPLGDGPIEDTDFCNEFMLQEFDEEVLQASTRYKSGKPTNARDLLLAGIQDTTQMLASNQVKLNDLILLVLETLYGAMGFRFATACLRDIPQGKYTARVAVGEKYLERQKLFGFPVVGTPSVFHLALSNNVDMMISDATTPKIQNMLPEWHKTLLPDTRSFMILPLVIEKKPIGLFYADRAFTAEEGVPPDETALIKTLKGQLLSALTRR
jgi:HD-like signal output (HDOD) protein